MKINGRDFRLFGKKDERPLCLVLLSEKIAENARETGTGIAGDAGTGEEGVPVGPPEGESK